MCEKNPCPAQKLSSLLAYCLTICLFSLARPVSAQAPKTIEEPAVTTFTTKRISPNKIIRTKTTVVTRHTVSPSNASLVQGQASAASLAQTNSELAAKSTQISAAITSGLKSPSKADKSTGLAAEVNNALAGTSPSLSASSTSSSATSSLVEGTSSSTRSTTPSDELLVRRTTPSVENLKRYRPAGSLIPLARHGLVAVDFLPSIEKSTMESNSSITNLQKDNTNYRSNLSASYGLGRWAYIGLSQGMASGTTDAVYTGDNIPDNRHTSKPSGVEETKLSLGLTYYHKSFSGVFDLTYKPKFGKAEAKVLNRDNLTFEIPDNTYTGGQDITVRAIGFADRYNLMSTAVRGGYTIRSDRDQRSQILTYANNGGAFQSGTYADTTVRGGNIAFAGAAVVFPSLLNLTLDYEYNHSEASFTRYAGSLVNTEVTNQSIDTHRVESLVEWAPSKYISILGGINYVFTKDNGGGKTLISDNSIYGGRVGARLVF